MAIETLTHEITTGEPAYYVSGLYTGTNPESALDEIRRQTERATDVLRLEITAYPPAVETLTLYPIDAADYSDVNDTFTVYLKVPPLRERNKILLIKLYRGLTDTLLRDAKDAVEGNDVLAFGRMPLGTARVLEHTLRLAFVLPSTAGGIFGLTYPEGPLLFIEHA